MTRRVVLAAVAFGLCLTACGLATEIGQVHLGWSQNDVYETMTVKWYSPVDANQAVYYDIDPGTVPSDYQYAVPGVSAQIQATTDIEGNQLDPQPKIFAGYYYTASLVGLAAGQTYSFRIFDEDHDTLTREWLFRTIEPDEPVEFAFAGDSQRPYTSYGGVEFAQLLGRPDRPANWPYMRDFITQKAAALDPDFFLGLGDFVSRGNNQSQWDHWFEAWQEYAVTDTGRMIPIVPVIGNHEMGGYPDHDSSYEWFRGLFAIPQTPSEKLWYSLDFPNLHLTVLAATSGQVGPNMALASYEAEAQGDWLQTDLLSAPAQGARWRFVAFHYNYLGCFDACRVYPSDVYMSVWNQALQGGEADVVFMGHSHNYTRSWPVWLGMPNPCFGGTFDYQLGLDSDSGITYITHGGWGGVPTLIQDLPGTDGGCQLRDWIAAAASHPSLGYVQLNSQTCSFHVEDTAGIVIDAFGLPYVPNYIWPEYDRIVP